MPPPLVCRRFSCVPGVGFPVRVPLRPAPAGWARAKETCGRGQDGPLPSGHHQQWPNRAGSRPRGTGHPPPNPPEPAGPRPPKATSTQAPELLPLHARACALGARGSRNGEAGARLRERRTRRSPCRAPGRQRRAADVDRG
ncbi:unnamed protein product [Urochloa humidicola]